MNTREKIISSLAGLALLGGAVHLLLPAWSPLPAPSVGAVDTATLRLEITGKLAELGISEQERARLAALTRPWTMDPFYRREPGDAAATDEDAPERLFRYSGYLEVGGRRLAIINGREYRERDSLEIPGYLVRRIEPDRVLIVGDGLAADIVVPYEESAESLSLPSLKGRERSEP